MDSNAFDFVVTPQPTETSCGPACLHAIYRYYDDSISLEQVMEQVEHLPVGGTLGVFLALHAMGRGYDATIYTCNLHMFDPSWFGHGASRIRERLLAQKQAKDDARIQLATDAYVEFLDRGGKLRMTEITPALLQQYLGRGIPIVTGLGATWLYRAKRDRQSDMVEDDIQGEPTGHFVVIHGVDSRSHEAKLADPYLYKPAFDAHHYTVGMDRLIHAILLGVITYDAKLLIITPRKNTLSTGPAQSI